MKKEIVEPYSFIEEKIELNELDQNNYDYDTGGFCPIKIGEILNGKYEIISYLGSGAYSTVWKCFNKSNSEHYAIKITKANKDDSEVAENEINILKKIEKNNKYVINLIDTFKYKSKNGKHICIVINLCGQDLHSLKRQFKYGDELRNDLLDKDSINESDDSNVSKETEESLNSVNSNNTEESEIDYIRCLPMHLVKKITKQLLEAIRDIHSKNIIHTDIKPENILLTRRLKRIKLDKDINIRLSDFGTAHTTADKCEFGIGTLEYSPPETLIGLPYGKSADIWSIGCIVFELITGHCLFDYCRYWDEASDHSSCTSYSSSEYDGEDDDKMPIELTLLAMMRRVLGGFPSKIFKRGKYYEMYFDYKGRLRNIPTFLEETTLEECFIEDCGFTEEETEEMCDFLKKMLSIDPSNRYTANELLNEEWLKE